jgi:hypothetical protein
MYPILIALLLAACLFDPWSHVDDVPFPGDATQTEDQREHRDPSLYVSSSLRLAQLFVKESRAATPSPTPPLTPSPEPTPEPTPAHTPEPTPAPTIPAYMLPPEELKALICSYAWPCEEALRVKWCEAGNRWDSIGFGANYGGFQINSIHARRIPDFWTSWMDPAKNTAWAFDIWSRQGWKPWACRPA